MFLLGRQQIHWVDFAHGIIWLLNSGYYETILPRTILGSAIFFLMCRPEMESVSREKRHPLLKVLDDARYLHATDRRDKVFALLAVSNEGSK